MNIKDFFRPTLAKILITLITIAVTVPFIHYDTGIRCIQAPCPASATGSILTFLLHSPNRHIYTHGISIPVLLVGGLLAYLLSCTLVWVSNKLKRNNTPTP